MTKFLLPFLVGGVLLLVPTLTAAAVLENPGTGGSYSGIGVISGWKCHAEGDLSIVFNKDGKHIPLLYGSERPDVLDAGACREAEVGFVAIMNWGELGEGTHTAVAYDDRVAFARSTFTVATLGEAFVEGASGECTIAHFPTIGETATFAWNQNTQHLELVPARTLADGFAPADQATFDRLAVGKRVVSVDDARYYADFLSAGRFVEVEPGERYSGTYHWRKTGPNTGTLTQHYDDGDVCTAQLTFTSAMTGRTRYTCNDGEQGAGDWRLIDIPSSSGGGAVQNDGQCRAGLVVHPGESCTHPVTGTFSVDSSGRGHFTVGGFTSQSGRSIQMRNTTINGQTLTFVAHRPAGGNSWTIDEVE